MKTEAVTVTVTDTDTDTDTDTAAEANNNNRERSVVIVTVSSIGITTWITAVLLRTTSSATIWCGIIKPRGRLWR